MFPGKSSWMKFQCACLLPSQFFLRNCHFVYLKPTVRGCFYTLWKENWFAFFFSVEILEGIFHGHKGGTGIFCVPQNAPWDWNIYIYHKSNPNVGKYTAKTRVLSAGTFNGKQKHVAGVRILGLVEVDRLSCLGVGSLTELPLKHWTLNPKTINRKEQFLLPRDMLQTL